MFKLLRADKELLLRKLEETEQRRKIEVGALEEQIHDIMLHFKTEAKIKEQIESGAISKEVRKIKYNIYYNINIIKELEQSNVELKEDTSKIISKKSRRRKK